MEQSKINLGAVLDFYRACDRIGAENHSLLIMKEGETVFEEYCYPYRNDLTHTMFSVTKSFVGIAVGFAIDEGKISLQTKILPYFTEYKHPESKQWEEMTVESLLTMQSNKKFSFLQDMTVDHSEHFMKAKFRKKKGFSYSNNDVHMLSYLVQKVTGEDLLTYLMPRLFEPLGIEKPFWEQNEKTVRIGGSGLQLKSNDLAKVCQCLLDEGKYNGKQVIPSWWIKESFKRRIQPSKHFYATGFGYCFWLMEESARMDGLFGQFGVVIPRHKTVIVLTGSYEDEVKVSRLVHDVLHKDLFLPSQEGKKEELEKYLEERNKRFLPIATQRNVMKEKVLDKTWYRRVGFSSHIAKLMTGFSNGLIANSLSSSLARRPKKSIDDVCFRFFRDYVKITWTEDGNKISFCSGLNGQATETKTEIEGAPYTVWSYAYWQDDLLHVVTRPINTLTMKEFVFSFKKSRMSFITKTRPDFKTFCAFNSVASGVFPDLPIVTPILIGFLKLSLFVISLPVRYKRIIK